MCRAPPLLGLQGDSPLEISDFLHHRIRMRESPPALRHGADGERPQGIETDDAHTPNFPCRCPITCARMSHPMSPVSRLGHVGCVIEYIVAICPIDRMPIGTCITTLVKIDRYWKTGPYIPSALAESFSITSSLSCFLHFLAFGSEFTNHLI